MAMDPNSLEGLLHLKFQEEAIDFGMALADSSTPKETLDALKLDFDIAGFALDVFYVDHPEAQSNDPMNYV